VRTLLVPDVTTTSTAVTLTTTTTSVTLTFTSLAGGWGTTSGTNPCRPRNTSTVPLMLRPLPGRQVRG
jgi:hypothetical protein